MDRLTSHRLPTLSSLTPDDLPRLIEQRKLIAASIEQAASMTEVYRLHDRVCILDEQIAYLKMVERSK